MHDERLDPEVGRLLRSARRAVLATPAPAPDERLATLFASGLPAAATPAVETLPARRRSSVKQLLSNVPAKVAAGVLGAGLAIGGLGVAGALPGNILLASSHHDEQVTTSDQQQATDTTEAPEVEKPDAADTNTTTDAPKPATPTDLSQVAVPTSVSEAAQTHAFDEACGNHGKYVSYFAQNGTEPSCATDARAAAANGTSTSTNTATQTATVSNDSTSTDSTNTSTGASTHGKSGSTHGRSGATTHGKAPR
ncbi:MAG TPA: hypothetical protein VHN98_13105 [Acidimicrobiales bacterium]|nr:hypothetical protein [Acidimicrobiales bacterium]